MFPKEWDKVDKCKINGCKFGLWGLLLFIGMIKSGNTSKLECVGIRSEISVPGADITQ